MFCTLFFVVLQSEFISEFLIRPRRKKLNINFERKDALILCSFKTKFKLSQFFRKKKAEYGKGKKKKVLGVHLKMNSEILARNKE